MCKTSAGKGSGTTEAYDCRGLNLQLKMGHKSAKQGAQVF
jgi:hypothetical protein